MVEHAESGTVIQLEVIILSTNLTNKPSPIIPMYKTNGISQNFGKLSNSKYGK
jgi:hypothetical protein